MYIGKSYRIAMLSSQLLSKLKTIQYVLFSTILNRTIPGIILSETVLSGDLLYQDQQMGKSNKSRSVQTEFRLSVNYHSLLHNNIEINFGHMKLVRNQAKIPQFQMLHRPLPCQLHSFLYLIHLYRHLDQSNLQCHLHQLQISI